MSSLDYAKALNDEQIKAVQAPDGPVLIIAAAGTGKTRTLIYRVAHLVEKGTSPNSILLLTFTNRAAAEMLDRARQLVGPSLSGLWGGTFHHLANRILRRHAEVLEYKTDFTILDRDDSRSLIRSILTDFNLKDKLFPKPDVFLGLNSLALNTESDLEDLVYKRFKAQPVNIDNVLKTLIEYSTRKRLMNSMDFDDLLIKALEIFNNFPDILQIYQERFKYVLVDEYQDTNHIQSRLIDLLSAKRRNLLVVGDDFQSIYSWRGANYKNILDFPKKYPECTVYKLETNYRSVPGILNVANQCIAGNPEQFQKTLRPVRKETQKPVWIRVQNGREQSSYIIFTIRELLRKGHPLRQIVVLYRSHFHAMELQLELTREGIPYIITSGVRFFEQAHIKDLCSMLRLINTPTDQLAFQRLLTLLPKVGPRTVSKIWNKLEGRFSARNDSKRKTILDSLPQIAKKHWIAVDQIFDRFIDEKLERAPAELVDGFLQAFYDEYAVDHFDNYARRKEDALELINYVSRFDTLQDFLNEMALLTNVDHEADRAREGEYEALRLSTIHQAKGLEWDTVFLLWLVEGMFPAARSMEESNNDSEERRLFYVATTRARNHLFMCSPKSRFQRNGEIKTYKQSRFINEIDKNLVERLA